MKKTYKHIYIRKVEQWWIVFNEHKNGDPSKYIETSAYGTYQQALRRYKTLVDLEGLFDNLISTQFVARNIRIDSYPGT